MICNMELFVFTKGVFDLFQKLFSAIRDKHYWSNNGSGFNEIKADHVLAIAVNAEINRSRSGFTV